MTAQTLEEHRRSIREIADAVAPGWERHRAFIETTTTPVREWMLRELAPQPGQTVLELAAGVGDTGFDAAVLAGERGRLICSDISPAMLDAARRRGAERGVLNVDYRLLDVEAIELGDDCVDGVLCRFAYMIVADPAAALAETRRVLRPGGRVALAVWGAPERNPFFSVLGTTLVRAGHMPPPDPSEPGPFSLGDPERVRGLLAGTRFTDVHAEEVEVHFRFRDADECVAHRRRHLGPMALVLQGLSEAERANVTKTLGSAFAPFRTGAGYEVPGVAVVAAGVASALQPPRELRVVGDEPDLPAAVALAHEVAQRAALAEGIRDVAHDREPQPVVRELLDELAGDAGAEREERGVEPRDRHGDPLGPRWRPRRR